MFSEVNNNKNYLKLLVKKGDVPKSDVSKDVKDIVDKM